LSSTNICFWKCSRSEPTQQTSRNFLAGFS
jgi:hypothetical protein